MKSLVILFLKTSLILSGTSFSYREKPSEVEFSHRPGFYSEQFMLELSHPDPETEIYYSLDGSVPDNAAIKYNAPLLIENRSDYDNHLSVIPTADEWVPPAGKVSKATIIRAVAIKPGLASSPVTSGTYFVFPEGREKHSLAVISLIADEDSFFSGSTGIFVNGNYRNTGREWEREVSLEFFAEDITFQQNCGVRIHGGNNGRGLSQKSLRLYARSEYGESRFNHRIFPDLPFNEYNRLILRNSGNDWYSTLFRDAAVHAIFSDLNFDTQAYRPVVLYINGEYWGIQNIRERYDKHYLARVYGVDPENLDILSCEVQSADGVIVKEGGSEHYDAVIEYMKNNDMGDEEHYEFIQSQIDTDNFIDYQAAQIFAANFDWPGNNSDLWRVKNDVFTANSGTGHDGRWRWLLFDTDVGFNYVRNNYVHNTLAFATEEGKSGWPNPDWATFLLRTLLTNEEFRMKFINRFSDLLNSSLLPERTTGIITQLCAALESGIPDHINRWNSISGTEEWEENVNEMIRFAQLRPAFQRDHIREYFELGDDVKITVSVEDPGHGSIRINTLDILASTAGIPEEPYPWSGYYFNGVPVRIEAVPAGGYRFNSWSGAQVPAENVLILTPGEDISLKASFIKLEEVPVISYWFFGTDLPNDTPLEHIAPVYSSLDNTSITYQSSLEGYPFDSEHEYWRMASLERRNAPTDINYLEEFNDDIPFADSGMRGIQVRQPLASDNRENTMVFHLPTTGHQEIELRFAAMDEGAAGGLIIDYSVSDGEPEWTNAGLENSTPDLSGSYNYYLVDFSSVEEAGNNPNFKVRIRFDAADMFAAEGNRVTFNNFSLHGEPDGSVNIQYPDIEYDDVKIYPNPASDILYFELGRETEYITVISLICTDGRVVAEQTLLPGEGSRGSFSLEGIDPGIYLVSIKNGQMAITRRVVVL